MLVNNFLVTDCGQCFSYKFMKSLKNFFFPQLIERIYAIYMYIVLVSINGVVYPVLSYG